jgi:GNAT superfamily N-acetyltransferase
VFEQLRLEVSIGEHLDAEFRQGRWQHRRTLPSLYGALVLFAGVEFRGAAGPVALRPYEAGDDQLLLDIYASTRDDLRAADLEPAALDALISMQHHAQDRGWRTEFPALKRMIVLLDGAPAGRLYLHHDDKADVFVDITLLPGHRGKGVGTLLITELVEDARRRDVAVQLHVATTNLGARLLYERLGFAVAGDCGQHLLMERRWPTSSA